MGQQQLLLLAAGTIIVAVAVVVGIQLSSSSAVQANRDAVTLHLVTLSAMAQNHYNRPQSMGGGGETFKNFIIPAKMLANEHGKYEHTQTGHDADHIHFTGTGIETGENPKKGPIQIEIRITEDATTFKTLN